MAETKRLAVVTGANKGIGYEISRQLASNGIKVILTARDEEKGTEAVESLESSGLSDVLFHQLDVAEPASVATFADYIKTSFGKLDILVNNAGIGGVDIDYEALSTINAEELKDLGVAQFDELLQKVTRESYETANECININYYGAKRVTEALIPFLQQAKSPKIVNISSDSGFLSVIPSETLKKEMGDVDEKSEERLDEVLKSYLNELKEGKLRENYWPTAPVAYKLSKVALSTYTRILAKKYPSVCINCVHPGFVKTDITHDMGELTVEEGAKGPVFVALLPEGSPSGLFYDKTEVCPF